MLIEINPRTLLNLENICEILYKLHPSVLDYLVDMKRNLGFVLGNNDLNDLSLEKREFFHNFKECFEDEKDLEDYLKREYEEEMEDEKDLKDESSPPLIEVINLGRDPLLKEKRELEELEKFVEDELKRKELRKFINNKIKKDHDSYIFHKELNKYIQLDTYEYIPMKIYVEVEDPVIGKKVRELVRALEITTCPEQFYWGKREIDNNAYFSESYKFSMNEEQEKKKNDLFSNEDVEDLKQLLVKEKLYEFNGYESFF